MKRLSKDDEAYRKRSRELLKELFEKSAKTIMVGALSKLEEEMGHLWGADGSSMTTEMIENKKSFDAVRKYIFDNGHNQINLIKDELDNYDVTWLRYQLNMKVKPRPTQEG